VRLTVVAPRYGPTVTGGAETAARRLAEELVARRGWTVDVLTTTALDIAWNDGFGAGTETIDGVAVHRFAITGRRAADFDDRSARLLPAPRRATAAIEQSWLEAQGPVSPGLIAAVRECDADVLALHPYLYHPTVVGAAVARRPVVLHGAAHDEPALGLRMYADLYANVAGLAFWSTAERALVLERFAVAATPQAVVGLGVDAGEGDPSAARQALGLGDDPYLLCLGRVDDAKGVALLARLFAAYRAGTSRPLRLVFAGAIVDRPDEHPDIVVTGPVDDATKWGLLRGASALVSPSAFESFGIVLTESWSVGRPVIVNGRCAVTTEHTRAARGGLVFDDMASFAAAVDALVDDPVLAERFGASGQEHTNRHFTWDAVLDRYERLLRDVAGRPVQVRGPNGR
jgi:glycosyltransferase involved in cell wall biosynthesis